MASICLKSNSPSLTSLLYFTVWARLQHICSYSVGYFRGSPFHFDDTIYGGRHCSVWTRVERLTLRKAWDGWSLESISWSLTQLDDLFLLLSFVIIHLVQLNCRSPDLLRHLSTCQALKVLRHNFQYMIISWWIQFWNKKTLRHMHRNKNIPWLCQIEMAWRTHFVTVLNWGLIENSRSFSATNHCV